MENTLRVITAEETKVTRKNSGPSSSPVTNITNVTKEKSMINEPFQHLKYETKETGFFLIHLEISVLSKSKTVTSLQFITQAYFLYVYK